LKIQKRNFGKRKFPEINLYLTAKPLIKIHEELQLLLASNAALISGKSANLFVTEFVDLEDRYICPR
jgi:hypothetical protein